MARFLSNWNVICQVQCFITFSSVQFSCSGITNFLQPYGLQHARLPCPSPTSRALFRLMPIELVMPSNHLILCRPFLLLPSIFLSISFPMSSLHQVAKVLQILLQHQSFQWISRTDFILDGLVRSPCCPRDSQESSKASVLWTLAFFIVQLLHPYMTTGKP